MSSRCVHSSRCPSLGPDHLGLTDTIKALPAEASIKTVSHSRAEPREKIQIWRPAISPKPVPRPSLHHHSRFLLSVHTPSTSLPCRRGQNILCIILPPPNPGADRVGRQSIQETAEAPQCHPHARGRRQRRRRAREASKRGRGYCSLVRERRHSSALCIRKDR